MWRFHALNAYFHNPQKMNLTIIWEKTIKKTLFPILIHTSLTVFVIDGEILKRNLEDTWKFITVKDLMHAIFVYLIRFTKTKIQNKERKKTQKMRKKTKAFYLKRVSNVNFVKKSSRTKTNG